jgi:hypothetical protein
MRKKPRPSFLRQLERRYGPNRDLPDEGQHPKFKPQKERKLKLPRVYPVSTRGVVRQPRSAAGEGVIDMVQQFVMLLSFVLLACAGSAAVAYGVVEAGQPVRRSAGDQGRRVRPAMSAPPGNEASRR